MPGLCYSLASTKVPIVSVIKLSSGLILARFCFPDSGTRFAKCPILFLVSTQAMRKENNPRWTFFYIARFCNELRFCHYQGFLTDICIN